MPGKVEGTFGAEVVVVSVEQVAIGDGVAAFGTEGDLHWIKGSHGRTVRMNMGSTSARRCMDPKDEGW